MCQKSHSNLSLKVTLMLLLTDNLLRLSFNFIETKELDATWYTIRLITSSHYSDSHPWYSWLQYFKVFYVKKIKIKNVLCCWWPRRFLQPKAVHNNKLWNTWEVCLFLENGEDTWTKGRLILRKEHIETDLETDCLKTSMPLYPLERIHVPRDTNIPVYKYY